MNNIIEINNNKYPELLKNVGKDAPKLLYYKGNIDLLKSNCLAVVGSRRMTTYGRQITEKLVSRIASTALPAGGQGITIVSGFMYGIDATAHKSAVDVGGKTIAVMPCGIDRVHPEYQVKLYNEILENNGLIISEYEGDTMPAYWTYPQRNKIVAGLSKAVLVTEAGEKSGSLITANLAKKYDRKIFTVPGPLTSVLSFGTNQLIKKGEAEIVTSAEDILKFYNKNLAVERLSLSTVASLCGSCVRPGLPQSMESKILGQLQLEPMEIDSLSRKLNKNIQEISRLISFMEIKGQIKKENNKYYVS